MIAEECCKQVPVITCEMEACVVNVKRCRCVPVCVPVCEPASGPAAQAPQSNSEWFARTIDKARCCHNGDE
jgi:hypothetical protein